MNPPNENYSEEYEDGLELLLTYFGVSEQKLLSKSVYKNTDCGAWIDIKDKGVTFGSIVEGSDAECTPIFIPWKNLINDTISAAIKTIEEEADQLWREANEE